MSSVLDLVREADATLGLAALAGMVLGALFFGALWWTARSGATSPRPALWFFGSLLLRMGILLPAFYVVAAGHWLRMLICLLGFLAARALVMRLTRPATTTHDAPQEARHAP
jgi:F1F0 ATPase subunit 2